jgi:arylsulfatase A-like enzyme
MAESTRRNFLRSLGAGAAASVAGAACAPLSGWMGASQSKPNIIYILADDLGYGEIGCYGQKKIKTPHIDVLAGGGLRFTQHYSGSAVCAPTRCMLLTGKDSGHAYIRANDEMGDRGDVWNDPDLEGQRPLLENTETIGTMLQRAGYKTGCVGKWGLGWYGSPGAPDRQGFDHYFGYICQREAHNYYPTHLWKDGKKVPLDNPRFKAHQKLPRDVDPNDPGSYARYGGKEYACDLMIDDAVAFAENNRENPFFLYFASPVPHVSLQVPDDSLKAYEGAFDETPYTGGRGYVPHRTPRAAYAAMISRLDRDVGRLVAALKRLGLYENTLIIFSSDNGPTYAGGVDAKFFESAGPLNGLKGSLLEGGIRVPMIAHWPGRIAPGGTTDHISAQWDVMATLADVAGVKPPDDTNGVSFLPTLTGGVQKEHASLYWEYNRQQAVRIGDWKGYRRNAKKFPDEPIRLYNLAEDIGEKRDVVKDHPEVEKRIVEIMNSRTPSVFDKWNLPPVKAGS